MTALSGRGRAWRTLRARVLAEENYCALCGRPVDKTLPNPSPGSAQVDHIVPVSLAPALVMDRSNLRLVHRICNLRRGTGRRRRTAAPAAPRAETVFGPLSRPLRRW